MQDSTRREQFEKHYKMWRVAAKAAEEAERTILRDELAGKPIDSNRRIEAATLAAEARRLLDATEKFGP
jgi:hypothetical protein